MCPPTCPRAPFYTKPPDPWEPRISYPDGPEPTSGASPCIFLGSSLLRMHSTTNVDAPKSRWVQGRANGWEPKGVGGGPSRRWATAKPRTLHSQNSKLKLDLLGHYKDLFVSRKLKDLLLSTLLAWFTIFKWLRVCGPKPRVSHG